MDALIMTMNALNREDVEQLANADPEEAAVEAYNTMMGYEEGEDHPRACVENVLMPMVQVHVQMAQALLKVYKALDL